MWCRAPPLSSMKCQTFSLQPCSITHELKSGLKKNMKWRIWRYPHWQLASATGARRAALGGKKNISFAYHTSKVLLLLKLPFSLHILFLSEKKKNWYSNPKWNLFLNVKQLNYQAYPSYLLNMGNILKLHTKSDFKLFWKTSTLCPSHFPSVCPHLSFCPRLTGYSLDKTAPRRGQRPPVLNWLNWWSDIRGHIWSDREQAGWEWQHAPGPQAGDGWLTADAEVTWRTGN